jgi:late competence protein required for DNA uptake (superfamily II DNA/RNA helicase)
METVALKRCPFCGSNDIRKVTTLSYCEIYCCNCMVKLQRGLYMGKYESLKEAENDFGYEAVKAWNRRTKYD